ncbi:hypothetical protein NIES4103_40440 [Nostoc sp. NIES-4103]|nr:hypothetical protein NIES4103_40440 [Nostoc sp. NIES-4103]
MIGVYNLFSSAKKIEIFKFIGVLVIFVIWVVLGLLIILQIHYSNPEYPAFETEIKNLQEGKNHLSHFKQSHG